MFDHLLAVDGQPFPEARLDDLDMSLVQRHISAAQERGRYTGPVDPAAFMQRYHVITELDGELVPTLAGVLAFTAEPERWLTSSGIDIAQFASPTPRSTTLCFIEQIRGNIFAVIDRAVQVLWDRSDHGYRLDGAQRIEEHAYPLVVLRELTVNALCHRDWTLLGSRTRIQMLTNYVEWISPGSLPLGVTVENLLEAQVSRNPALVNLLFQAGYIEGLGLGMDTVFNAMRDSSGELPEIRNSAHAFTVKVTGKAVREYGVTPMMVSNDRKVMIRTLIAQRGSLSISEMETLLGIHRRTLQRDLRDLVEEGMLEVRGATNNRRYFAPNAN